MRQIGPRLRRLSQTTYVTTHHWKGQGGLNEGSSSRARLSRVALKRTQVTYVLAALTESKWVESKHAASLLIELIWEARAPLLV